MQLNLFETRIQFDELCKNCNSLEWYKTNGIVIRQDSEYILNPFYDMEYSYQCPPLYLMDAVNAEIEGKTDMRYMIIEVNHEEVLIVFRIIQLMKTKRIHVFDIPLSENKECSMRVLKILRESSIVTCIFKEKYAGLFENPEPKEFYNDYYYDLEKDDEELFSNNTWQKDIGIRKFLSETSDYKIINVQNNQEYHNAVLECRKRWWESKCQPTRDNEMKFLVNSLSICSDKVWNVALLHKDAVLAVKTLIIHKDYAVMPLLFHVSRDYKLFREKGIDNIVLRHLDKCLRYASGKMLLASGIKREYILGFAPDNKSLKNHKEIHSDGVIRYFQSRK